MTSLRTSASAGVRFFFWCSGSGDPGAGRGGLAVDREQAHPALVVGRVDAGHQHLAQVWTPLAISTFVDDQHVWTIDISDPDAFSGHEFHAPHFLIINLAVGGTFTGIFNSNEVTASLPARCLVDYVRVFDNGHTMLSGSGLEHDDCVVDLDGDGEVGGMDLAQLLARWGTSNAEADLDQDGSVGAKDLTLLLGSWGTSCEP